MKTAMKPRNASARSPAPGDRSVSALSSRPAGQTDHLRAWMHAGLHDLPHDSTILALGCDEVFLAPQLTEYSSDVTVLDTPGGQLTQVARRFPEIAFLRHNPAHPLPFAHDTFDAIWCCEFLDRIFDPTAALAEMHRVLNPGGRLLVTVPDHGTLRTVLIALFKWEEHFAPTNPRIRHFTRGMLAKLARRAGFEHVRTKTGGSVRRIAGSLVPRSILLDARKGPAALLTPLPHGRGANHRELDLGDELAFASRVRSA